MSKKRDNVNKVMALWKKIQGGEPLTPVDIWGTYMPSAHLSELGIDPERYHGARVRVRDQEAPARRRAYDMGVAIGWRRARAHHIHSEEVSELKSLPDHIEEYERGLDVGWDEYELMLHKDEE